MKEKNLTTNQGVPVSDNQNSFTVGERGPVLLQDVHLIEKLAHFDRERIPERVVHAKGAGLMVTSKFLRAWQSILARNSFKTQRRRRLFLCVSLQLSVQEDLPTQPAIPEGLQ